MTKARIIAKYMVESANIVDNTLSIVKFDTTNLSNVKDYGTITDGVITLTDDMGTII